MLSLLTAGLDDPTATYALKEDGTLWGWGPVVGANMLAKYMMDPDPFAHRRGAPEPVPIVNDALIPLAGIRQLAGQGWFTCALDGESHAWCWDILPSSGGFERPSTDVAVQVAVAPGTSIVEISVGDDMICQRDTVGEVQCEGINNLGQLGDGTTVDRFTMAPVLGLPAPAVRLVSGSQHSCAVLTDRTLWCWGSNRLGQLGVGDTKDRLAPVQVRFRG